MATLQDEQRIKAELSSALSVLAEIRPQDMVRVEELGKNLSFEPGLPIFERTLKLFHDLHQSNLDNVSFNALNSALTQAKDALSRFEQIKSFSPVQQTQNPIGVRDRQIAELQNQYDSYFGAISPILAYSIRKGTDFEALEKQARSTVSSIDALETQLNATEKRIVAEMESVLQKVRQAAAEVGVAQHSTHFKDEADSHKTMADVWLRVTVWAAALTLVWGVLSFFIHPAGDPPSTAQILQFTFAKLIILSALYYSLVWAARNYSAHNHNNVVNKHRANCLRTFETFVKATGDDVQTKNAVLLQTTQSIFNAQASGFAQRETDSESPNKIIEIIRSITSPAHKS